MTEYEKQKKFHFIVATLFSLMVEVFKTAESRDFCDEDYFWWAEHFTLAVLNKLDEGKEIIEAVEKKGGQQ